MTIRANKYYGKLSCTGLFHVSAVIAYEKVVEGTLSQFVGRVPLMVIDTGSAVSVISGYDATNLKIDYDELTEVGYSSIGSYDLRSFEMESVMLAFIETNGRAHREFLDYIEVLEPEPALTPDNHIPSLIGLDILEKYRMQVDNDSLYLQSRHT